MIQQWIGLREPINLSGQIISLVGPHDGLVANTTIIAVRCMHVQTDDLRTRSRIHPLLLAIIHFGFLTSIPISIGDLNLPLFSPLRSTSRDVPCPRSWTPIRLRIRLIEDDFIGSIIVLHIRVWVEVDRVSGRQSSLWTLRNDSDLRHGFEKCST